MFEIEADWIAKVLGSLPDQAVSPCLDLGSSDLDYRTESQPWIHERVFAPLLARRAEISYCDLKDAPGVDLVVDLMRDADRDRLADLAPRLVLCCNILEHVGEPDVFVRRLASLVQPGGRILFTVPHRYPYHEDPIDNGLRPNIEEVTGMFPAFAVERSAILEAGNYRADFARRPLRTLARHLARLLLPFLGLNKWKQSAQRLLHLFRPYEVTCVLLVKNEGVKRG